MIPLAKKPQPAAVALLRQANALAPKRNKASDGLLPSAAHVHQNPNSDHNSGFAVDLTHDPKNGMDCRVIYSELQKDSRVKYLIFNAKIWSRSRGENTYTGPNRHDKHLHVSIKEDCGEDTKDWFPWVGGPKKWNKVKSKFIKANRKKKEPTSPKED
jgi:hypothetical protein